ncbi:molybdopterin-binding protein [uncultured Megasphaera sp.]|uniref:molybdopterin-binding protein n=1 Tax=uncultured Megasphaera sp. TaxID=165188 RepID=UPI0025D8C47B|nr:molybdopterin-binding protein [uncultured Megasphaera sp.]
MSMNLLEKTELWINHITLNDVNLTELADTVAGVLGLQKGEVMVVDVRPQHITFDVLVQEIPQENFLGKEKAILNALQEIQGVTLYEDTYIHSNGILGQICANLSDEQEKELLNTVDSMTSEIRNNVLHRAIVFPTGFELQQGLIEDTNTPYIKRLLENEGYKVTIGEIMSDDLYDIKEKLEDALNRGFGLLVTSGGVGAEDKDKTVEAIHSIDETAATPYIVKFKKGTGRHVKDGVRIGVGVEGLSTMVSLPGPHDEVELAMPVLIKGLRENWDKAYLAECLAGVLANKWKTKIHCHQ